MSKNRVLAAPVDRSTLTWNLGLPITRPLQPGRIGSFYYLGVVNINTTDTPLSHSLGRIPSIYLVGRNQGGGIVHDGTNSGTDWTTSSIVLRATVAGNYGVLIA